MLPLGTWFVKRAVLQSWYDEQHHTTLIVQLWRCSSLNSTTVIKQKEKGGHQDLLIFQTDRAQSDRHNPTLQHSSELDTAPNLTCPPPPYHLLKSQCPGGPQK